MDKKTFEKISDTVEENIKNLAGKGITIKPDELECLNKFVGIAEKLSAIKERDCFIDEEGYSENDGNSYRRGRSAVTGRYVSRNSMPYHDGSYGEFYGVGRLHDYHNDGNFSRNYSGHSQKDMQIYHLEQMMNSAQNESERQFIRDWINRIKNS